MELETIIGLEIHAQLNTKSKLFGFSDNDSFGAPPNSRIDEIDLGLPGVLPVLNKSCVTKACHAALALGCTIQPYSKFDRKNYFYPDLPFGYQISQYDQPLALDGQVIIDNPPDKGKIGGSGSKTIGITRVHIENDAGKLTHTADQTLCDYNRSGAPLIEIVTEPDLRSADEARTLAREIQKILRYVNASNADMEKGMMRFDASISLRPKGDAKLYARAEIKNLNSFQSLYKALKYEQQRQTTLWEAGTPPTKETTMGWLDNEQKTHVLRDKESADDYRYFPEPDLPPLTFSEKEICDLQAALPELPRAKYQRYIDELKLSDQDALKLSENPELAKFFEDTTTLSKNPKKSANLILSVILSQTNWQDSPITPQFVADAIELLTTDKISSTGAKELLYAGMKTEKSAEALLQELGLEQSSNTGEMEAIVDQIIAENPNEVADFRAGNQRVMGHFMGQFMKATQGKGNPKIASTLFKELLNSE